MGFYKKFFRHLSDIIGLLRRRATVSDLKTGAQYRQSEGLRLQRKKSKIHLFDSITTAKTLKTGKLPAPRPLAQPKAAFMSDRDQPQSIYRVFFHNQGQVYELYAHNIYQSELYGFVEIEDYTFGTRSQLLIDPAEDRLRSEFEGVQRSFIPMHAIVRIDEVEKEGVAKITDGQSNKVTPFPMPVPRDTK